MVQLVWEAREAKHSLMQSQDCIRLMASSAAATEARANQLQDQLETVHHFLLNCWASAVHHFFVLLHTYQGGVSIYSRGIARPAAFSSNASSLKARSDVHTSIEAPTCLQLSSHKNLT
jgi:hypothetical protein